MVALVIACAQVRAEGPVLHEHVPDVDPDEAVLELSNGKAEPLAIEQDDEVLLAPSLGEEQPFDEPPMVAEPGDGVLGEAPGQRSPTFTPDRMTELEGTLDYYENFRPVIAPFKRVTSLDATLLGPGGSPVLAIASAARRAVPIEGASGAPPDARTRDRFWGEATLDFAAGRALPMPSVSPESRILTLKSEPEVALRVERDGADNFFVVLGAGLVPAGPVKIAFLTDAPTGYFAGEIPRAPIDALAHRAPRIDPKLALRGRALAAEIGVRPGMDLHDALHVLTAHFRAFEESRQPPPDTGDVYADLVRGKKGVCRHRAYGFVVTAHALGIPARFVQNEAHSFVEVQLPGSGGVKESWRRIDLGGAAQGMIAHGAEDAPVYQPKEPDALPRPAAYAESYSQLGRSVQGVQKPDDAVLQGRWLPVDAKATGFSSGVESAGTGTAAGTASAQPDAVEREAVAIKLDPLEPSLLRGQQLAVGGRIEGEAGQGVAGLRVEVSFAAQGRRERLLLGVAVTDQEGRFAGAYGVPPDLAVGDYELVVITPGDALHAGARAK